MNAPSMKELVGRSLGSHVASYDDRDVMLYALAIGAHATDLDLVYERDLQVLPTFALPLGLWAVEAAGALATYDHARSLHVGQELVVPRAMPVAGAVEMGATISNVWDKGAAALVEIAVTSDYFTTTYLIFVPGAGGFGGERGPSAVGAIATDPPSRTTQVVTTPDQAALYRLTGDRHPVHIDPSLAQAAGFERPILHGLCTLGAVAMRVAEAQGRSPLDVRQIMARFSAPVQPGATLDVSLYQTDHDTAYVATVQGVGTVVSGKLSLA
ncbi:MAG: enoyl-CoA hydratase [Acidimicrobiaceae bacterium]|nr:enoyl-CoA hydratase [Acidimicrobiaceae bacterium]